MNILPGFLVIFILFNFNSYANEQSIAIPTPQNYLIAQNLNGEVIIETNTQSSENFQLLIRYKTTSPVRNDNGMVNSISYFKHPNLYKRFADAVSANGEDIKAKEVFENARRMQPITILLS